MKFLIIVALALLVSLARGKGESLASWYGARFQGKPMANGKPFDLRAMTAASWKFPLGTRVVVTHEESSVVVTVTDRGPHKRFKNRVIDLSQAAFERLASTNVGLISVTIEQLK